MINCWLFSSRITPYRTSLVFVDGILNAVRYIRHNISHRSNLSISCIRIYLALCFSKTIKQDHTWLVYLWLLFRSRTLMSCLGNKIHQTHQVHPEPVVQCRPQKQQSLRQISGKFYRRCGTTFHRP
jgi:hypothetical protein